VPHVVPAQVPQYVPSDKNLDDSYEDDEDFDIEKPQEISEDEESIEEQNFASQIHVENQMEKDFAHQTNYQSSSHNTFLAGNSGSQNNKLPVLKPEEDESASFLNQQQQQNFNLNLNQMQQQNQAKLHQAYDQ
jgi:hypothetical protein